MLSVSQLRQVYRREALHLEPFRGQGSASGPSCREESFEFFDILEKFTKTQISRPAISFVFIDIFISGKRFSRGNIEFSLFVFPGFSLGDSGHHF